MKRKLLMIAFKHTLFPEPVAPATRRCGILARSVTKGAPVMSFPRAMVNLCCEFLNAGEERISSRYTMVLWLFGISMPMAAFPGIGATMRTLGARRARARSSERPATLLILTPGAGLSSYIVMTGPGRISTTSPSTSKSASFASSRRAFISRLSFWISTGLSVGALVRRSRGGRLNSPATFMKGKASCSGFLTGSGLGSTIVTWRLGLVFSFSMYSSRALLFLFCSVFFMESSLIRLTRLFPQR